MLTEIFSNDESRSWGGAVVLMNAIVCGVFPMVKIKDPHLYCRLHNRGVQEQAGDEINIHANTSLKNFKSFALTMDYPKMTSFA